jgi:septal ring-binding cell division protein DamX
VAAEAESLPEPEAPAVTAPEPEPVVAEDPIPQPVDEPVAAPVVDAPAPAEAEMPEPAQPSAVHVADAPVAVESMPEPEPAPAAAVEPQPAAAETATSAPQAHAPVASTGRLYLSSLQGARAFALLPSSHFTLQLAHAPSAENFPALIQQLGIDHRQCYVLRVRRDDGDWFVLAFGSFVDANAAKSALMQIRPAPGMTAVWPRRVGYLQGEYRP